MTATDELRRLLDERGVEWDYGIGGASTTRFNVNGVDINFTPMRGGLVCSTILTPEQAIAATLGSFNCTNGERTNGTCHDLAVTPAHSHKTEFKCSKCGYEYNAVGIFGVDSGDDPDFNYCPNCGRKVVDE